jgi:hypothetical protein
MRLILIILFIYALISFILRQVVPSLMRKYVNNFQRNFTENQQRTYDNKKKEGEISITYVNQDKNKTINPDDADYVDYEEIK